MEEEVVESTEEEVEGLEEEAVETVEEAADVEVIATKGEVVAEPPPPGYMLSLARWYAKLEELRKILEEELERKRDPLERRAVAEDLVEVERERRYVLWKLVKGLNSYKASCNGDCSSCPLELLCKSLPKSAPKSRGAKRPWLIAPLMHKYRLL